MSEIQDPPPRRWKLHVYNGRDERDVEIMAGRSCPASYAQLLAAEAVLTGKMPDLRADLDADARAILAQHAMTPDAADPRALLAEVLARLVELKDGPRDDHYRESKDRAWAHARAALAAAEKVTVHTVEEWAVWFDADDPNDPGAEVDDPDLT